MEHFIDFAKKFNNTKEIIEKTKTFVSFLLEQNKKINLIGKSTINDIWTRHILDCAQLMLYMNDGNIIDIGSGNGLPGIILAIISSQSKLLLIEKSIKKSLFLKETINHLELKNITIINKEVLDTKIEIINFKPNYITCRAFKSLKEIFSILSKIELKNEYKLILPKGNGIFNELKEINTKNLEFEIKNSILNNDAYIFIVHKHH